MTTVTRPYGGASVKRRVGAAGLAIAIHVLALGLALVSVTQSSRAPAETIATFDVSDPGPPAPEPTAEPQPIEVVPMPPQPVVVPPPPVILPDVTPMVVALLEQADTQDAGGCDLTFPVQVALQTNDAVKKEIATIPDERRSVANALAMWNQSWVEPDRHIHPIVIDVIKTTVAVTVAAASEACRRQLQGGPRFIYIPGERETTVLALGSGEWTWQEVADSAQPDFVLRSSDDPAAGPQALEFTFGQIFHQVF